MASVLPTARKEPLVSAPHPKDPCPSSDGTFLETLRMAFPDTQGKPAVSLFENLQLNAQFSDLVKPGAGSVKCVLAPSFGMLGKETYKEMDAALSLMLVSTIRELQIARSKGPGSDLTWEAVNAVLKQNTYLEHDPGISVHRVQDFTRDSVSIFKTRGKNKSNRNFAIAKEVEGWITELIKDSDVLALAIANPNPGNIPIKEVQAIVARTGSDKNLRGPDGTFSKTFLDIGILRFPDPEFPFIRIYRIKLSAWATCQTTLGIIERNINGITGEYQSCHYNPRRTTIDKMCPDIQKRAMKEAEALFPMH